MGGNCVGGNEREFFSAHFGTHMGFQNGVQIRFKLFSKFAWARLCVGDKRMTPVFGLDLVPSLLYRMSHDS